MFKLFAGKGLWKGPSRHRVHGTRQAGIVAGARMGRMGHARSPNGIIGHVGTCFVPLSQVKRCKLAGPQYNWGPYVGKLLIVIEHSRVMSPMVDGVPAHGVTGSASNQGVESGHSQLPLAMLGFKHATLSFGHFTSASVASLEIRPVHCCRLPSSHVPHESPSAMTRRGTCLLMPWFTQRGV